MKRTLVAMSLLVVLGAGYAGSPPAAVAQDYRRSSPTEVKDKPSPTYPEPRGQSLRALDIAVLAGVLLAAAWLVLRRRSRNWLIALLAGSLVYFGFYRAGCVCPIGAIQNVVLSAVDSSYTISIVVTAIFVLPLLATLLFGRVFCGGACPLGACQDLIHRVPVRVPMLLDKVLRWGRWIYLGLAIYWVVGGLALFGHDFRVTPDFLICKYDPFVNLFRAINFRTAFAGDWANTFQFIAPWWMWIVTGAMLGTSIFIGRPYCRWLCPYGALLGVCSRASRKQVTVMPADCCDCELCSDACPFGAIEDHKAVQAACLACARCYANCPLERVRLGWAVGPQAVTTAVAAERPKLPPPERSPARGRRLVPAAEPQDVSYVEELVARHGRDQSAALPILQAIQARHRYLPHPALLRVVELTELTMADLLGLATFYNQFRLAPIGKHLVKVCCGTACHVAGARRVSDAIRLWMHLPADADTDATRLFTVQEVACVGCCSMAPVMQVDDVTFGRLTAEKAAKALETFTPQSHKRHVEQQHERAALEADGGLHQISSFSARGGEP